jgi:hypothetical protein
MIIAASVAVGSNYWLVGFQDCGTIEDQYFILHLEEGLCTCVGNNDCSTTEDYDDCRSWSDLTDLPDDDGATDAQAYIDAKGLAGTALAVAIVLAVVCVARVFLQQKFAFLRFVQAGVAAVFAIFAVAAFGSTGNTFYTDTDSYGLGSICLTTMTFPTAGYTSLVIGFIISLVTILCVFVPCCCCADKEDGEPATKADTTNTQSPLTKN